MERPAVTIKATVSDVDVLKRALTAYIGNLKDLVETSRPSDPIRKDLHAASSLLEKLT